MKIRSADSFAVKNRKKLWVGAENTDFIEPAALERSPRAHGTGGLRGRGGRCPSLAAGTRTGIPPGKDRAGSSADVI